MLNRDHPAKQQSKRDASHQDRKVYRVLVALLWPVALAASGFLGVLGVHWVVGESAFSHGIQLAFYDALVVDGTAGLVIGLALYAFRVSVKKNSLCMLVVVVAVPLTKTYLGYVSPTTTGMIVEARFSRSVSQAELMEIAITAPKYASDHDVDPKSLPLLVSGRAGGFFELEVRRKCYLKSVRSLFSNRNEVASYDLPVGENETRLVFVEDSANTGKAEPSLDWERYVLRWQDALPAPPRSLLEYLYVSSATPCPPDIGIAP